MSEPLFGAPRQLTSGEAVDLRVGWDPSGERLVFERWHQDPQRSAGQGSRTLWSIGADGLGLAPLGAAVNPPGTGSTGRPAFLGSDDFVFVSDRSGREALYRSRRGEVRPFLLSGEPCYGPACGARGPVLHFRAGAVPGEPPTGTSEHQTNEHQTSEYHLWTSDREGRGARPLTAAAGVQDQPWPLPDGRCVYHAHQDGVDRVMLLDLTAGEGADGSAVSLSPPEGEGTAYVTPYPSPDGAWIAFTRAEPGLGEHAPGQVWVMRPDGSERQQVTLGEPHCFPAWSPDGRTLVVVRGEPTLTPTAGERGPSGHLWLYPLR